MWLVGGAFGRSVWLGGRGSGCVRGTEGPSVGIKPGRGRSGARTRRGVNSTGALRLPELLNLRLQGYL